DYNGALSTVVTNGLLIDNRIEVLLKSHLKRLIVSINGHTGEEYHKMTGMPSHHFHTVRDQVKKLVVEKKKKSLKVPLDVYLSIIIDRDNYTQIPDMIRFAQDLKVDGIIFENYISPDPNVKSVRTLFSDDVEILNFLDRIRPGFLTLDVKLPQLLDRQMEHHRNCQDAFTSVTVDGDCNISACSRQLLFSGKMGKLWEPEFWNNELYQWLRGVHHAGIQPFTQNIDDFPVPRPCQNCPNNCGVTMSTHTAVDFQ
ncbi:MAG: hypothetical protein K2X66_13895, partial [Cyanobacteria bacterium]|nr:hypothetical protein [Cyanobacteriota bacterium]